MHNVTKWLVATVLVVGSSIGWADQTAEATTPAPVMSCWFEPKDDGTYEGLCGASELRPADALDDMRMDVTELSAADVARWKGLGAYPDSEDHCECLYVPVAPGFGSK